MRILLSVRKNFKVILKIIILNYYLICNHLRYSPAKNVLSLSDQATHCITLTIFRSEESRRLIAGIESDKASHKTDHDI